MIERISTAIVMAILHRSDITADKDDIEVYVYGMNTILNLSSTVVLLLIWSWLIWPRIHPPVITSLVGTLLWLISFFLLRKHTGGFHLSTQIGCIIGSTLLGASASVLSFLPIVSSGLPLRIISAVIFVLLALLLLATAPIESRQKPLNTSQKRQSKRLALITLAVLAVVSYCLPSGLGLYILHACATTGVLGILAIWQIR